MISLTIDVEQYGNQRTSDRYLTALQPLLSELQQTDVVATFFVVGEMIPNCANLLRELSLSGHEIALHGHTHQHLRDLEKTQFKSDISSDKRILEDLLQTEIVGFRAPYFSLTKETKWASDELAELGFAYSSSVLPARNSQAGFPGAPRSPFLWPSGLIELPVTTFGIGYLRAPIIGGAYLRLSPRALVVAAKFQAARNDFGMTYCHPYDFDDQEPFMVREGDSWIFSKLLFARRK